MHELPVVEDMIKTLDRTSEEKGILKIREINLVIGELSGIIGECVQMYFDMLSKGHSCEGAVLKFEHIPAMLKCTSCGAEFPHGKRKIYQRADALAQRGTGKGHLAG